MTEDELFNASLLEDRDRIAIVMQEYSTLRSEIIARTGFAFQITAISAAALTWLVGQRLWDPAVSGIPWWGCVVIAFISGVVMLLFLLNKRDVWKAAERLREIEHEVNSRSGERLLGWESTSGAGRMSYWRSLFSSLPRTPVAELKPLDERYVLRSQKRRARERDDPSVSVRR